MKNSKIDCNARLNINIITYSDVILQNDAIIFFLLLYYLHFEGYSMFICFCGPNLIPHIL